MRHIVAFFTALICALTISVSAPAQQRNLDAIIDQELPSLVATYKQLHAAPELSHNEVKTSALVARELRGLGYTLTEHVGKYSNPQWKGHGVVAVMKNGEGPTVLVRADMDALPVEEKTDLAYASSVKTKDDVGQEVSVMHACGHDIHITALLGTAKMLARLKDQWHGTVMLVGQPAEETIDGAQAMIADDLYGRFPKPNYCIALHDYALLEAGKVGYTPGDALASATSVDVTIRGLGGHGSKPEATKDPVVTAAQFILALQTIISRENSPFDPAVVTVGSIHGGTRYNIIPDEVHLQLTIRTYKEEVRQKILTSIERIAKGVAAAAGIPENRAPIVKYTGTEYTPAMYNDPQLTGRLVAVFQKALGAENVVPVPAIMGSEDFGSFGLENREIPSCLFWLGGVDPAKFQESKQTGQPLPYLHSSLWAPVPEPTLRTGVKAMTSAVMELMR